MNDGQAQTVTSEIIARIDGAAGRITLNRPKALNALSGALIDALQTEFDHLKADRRIRVVVIEANGRAFSPGHDLREMRATNDQAVHRDLLRRCSTMMLSIRALPQPVIAKVHAIATAAGCQLVAACDLAVAASTATFGTHGVNNGLFCGTPSVPVGRNVGAKRALDMLLSGEEIDAATALRDGLVSRVVPPEQLDAETLKLARRIAGQSPLAVAGGKAMFHRHMEMNLTDAYAFATEYMAEALASEDARDGIDAFIAKRPTPDWKGR